MTYRMFVAAVGLLLSLGLSVTAAAQVAVDEAKLERDLTILAADDMEGREAGTPGYDRAAGYVAGRMAALGLEPGGTDGTYFQQVPLREYAHTAEGNTLAINGLGELEYGEDFVLSGGPRVQSGTFSAPLVFIGYGLQMDGRDDLAGVDLEGAIVVRLTGAPENLDQAEVNRQRSTLEQRLSDRGALGVLLLHTPKLDEDFPWSRLSRIGASSRSMTWLSPDGEAESDEADLLVTGYISPHLSRTLLDGLDFDYTDVAIAEATDEALLPSFAIKRRARVSFSSEFADIVSPNVIGLIPGTDPDLADQYVVLTAHLDHVGVRPTETPGDDEIYNGALDNAVGVASMLEVARLLADNPPARPVLVVALTAEEKGLLGSAFHAAHPTVPASHLAANVNLDMPVITYDFSDVVAFGAEHSNLYPQVLAATEEYGLEVSPDPQPEQNFFTRSDQYSYVRAGIPAVYLDLGFGNGGEEAQGIVFAEHYHEPSDEVDLIDWQALYRFTGVNYLIARNVANMAERPAWNAGDFYGLTYGGPMQDAE
ncbi:M28 family peptidase [Aurantiacibacter gilvus]|uniref:M28 family peptidase n=1 Tax=Aurantiacibacter gilvus TaxID=3139141 RepID=A0ABU9IBJ1_9SPHN